MALQDQQPEPSMEEILASIRRIISEEDQVPQAPVLDLTETAAAPPLAAGEDDLVFEAVEPPALQIADQVEEPSQAPPLALEPVAPPEVRAPELGETILSPPTASAAAGALSRLAGTLRIADAPGQTIEGVVRELLRPMLKEWLDRNLPAIVEARVEAELERIARMAR